MRSGEHLRQRQTIRRLERDSFPVNIAPDTSRNRGLPEVARILHAYSTGSSSGEREVLRLLVFSRRMRAETVRISSSIAVCYQQALSNPGVARAATQVASGQGGWLV